MYTPEERQKYYREILKMVDQHPRLQLQQLAEKVKESIVFFQNRSRRSVEMWIREAISGIPRYETKKKANGGPSEIFEEETANEGKYKFTEKGDEANVRKIVDKNVKTLEELKRVCEIDDDIWDVKEWKCGVYESHVKLRKYSVDKDGKQQRIADDHKIVPLWLVNASLVRNKAKIDAMGYYDDLIADAKKHAPKYKKIRYPKVKKGTLLEVDIFDFHLGRDTWEEESGEEGSLARSEKDFMFCINDLLSQTKVYPISRILFPVGNDFFNADNYQGTTTAGTKQQESPIWRRTYRFGRELLVKAIDLLSEVAPVDVLIIPGNHDMQRVYYLGDGLACWYHNNPNVTIDNSPKKRKYYQHGSCLIGFAHGKTERLVDLPTIMTTEEKQKFALTKFHEWHLGDKHHEKKINWVSINETQGVVVRILRSLALHDEWSIDNGYIGSQRSAEGFVWDEEGGMRAHLYVNL